MSAVINRHIQLAFLDGRFVNVVGDSMTGALTITKNATQLTLHYDAANNVTFTVESDGDLTLNSNKASYDLDFTDANLATTGTISDGVWTTDDGVMTGIASLDGAGTIDLEDNLDGTGFTITGDTLTDGTATLTGGNLKAVQLHNTSDEIVMYLDDYEFFDGSTDTIALNYSTRLLYDVNENIVFNWYNGALKIPQDNLKLYLGLADDCSIYYDNTDMVIKPAEVGSGAIKILASDDSKYLKIYQDGNTAHFNSDSSIFLFQPDTVGSTALFRVQGNGVGTARITAGIPDNTDNNNQLFLAGSSPGIFQEVQRASGGFSFNIFNMYGHKTSAAGDAMLGKIGILGSFGTDEVAYTPVATRLYFGLGSAVAYNSNAFYIDNNNHFHMPNDNASIKMGLADDATITFDSDSLNIVANAVTGTDDLVITAENINLTAAGEFKITNTDAYGVAGNTLEAEGGRGLMTVTSYNKNNVYSTVQRLRKSHHTDVGSLAATVTGEEIGLVGAYGVNSGNSAFVYGGGVSFTQTGAAGASRIPLEIIFKTSPGGTTAPVNRFSITPDGDCKIPADSNKLYLGAGDDSSITDTGSLMTINPDENSAGSRPLTISGNLDVTGTITCDTSITVGSTAMTEQNLIDLLALLP